MYHSFLIHSSADEHLGCFHVLAIINSAVRNIGVHVSFSDLVSLVCMPRSGIARSNYYFKCKWIKCSNQKTQTAEWIQKQDPYICCLQETHFRFQDTYRRKVRGWKNISHANGKPKKPGVAILISDRTELKKKKITRDKEGHYIMIKGSIQEEDIAIVNIYAPSIKAPQYIRQTLTDIKGEMESNTIIVGDFNTPLTPMDR